jgi:hypothetical protein
MMHSIARRKETKSFPVGIGRTSLDHLSAIEAWITA